MFNFKEELAKYRKSLETTELSGGVSGDEVRDILDIAKELVNARAAGYEPEAVAPVATEEKEKSQVNVPEAGELSTEENEGAAEATEVPEASESGADEVDPAKTSTIEEAL